MIIFKFLNDQVLKMQWLYDGVRWLVVNVFNLDMSTRLGGSVHFFIYDVIKIFILLTVLIYLVSYVQSYYPPERTRAILGRLKNSQAIPWEPFWAPLHPSVPVRPYLCS